MHQSLQTPRERERRSTRKLLCLCLSLLLAVQSGCYSARIASSIEKDALEPTHLFASLSEGQLVRVFAYKENRDALEVREGRILRIREDALIIRYLGHPYPIEIERIQKIEVLDRELNVGRTIVAVVLTGPALYVLYFLVVAIIIATDGGIFE